MTTERERELVLPPNTFCHILDETKGNVTTYVGPHKTSLANTDRPVKFDEKTKKFSKASLEEATQSFAIAPEGWYLVLKNPSSHKQPTPGPALTLSDEGLSIGRKINIPGPKSFALWPGQMVKVIQGHRLRSNQYLMVRVYDEEAALKNLNEAIVKATEDSKEEQLIKKEDIVVGKISIIKGTDVSFYIPPTGIEALKVKDSYIQSAVTLERLEYCILLDESGNKRYIKGPSVVFPEPTENFVEDKDGARKFKAKELSEISGIHVKVTMDYEENDSAYKAGDELFITGKETPIYYPRVEHAVIGYGDKKVYYATAIPEGEGRYLLDRLTGKIELMKGPKMLLPDPRTHVFVRRVLTDNQVALWFPDNEEALEYNRSLRELNSDTNTFIPEQSLKNSYFTSVKGATPVGVAGAMGTLGTQGSLAVPGAYTSTLNNKSSEIRYRLTADSMSRGTSYTKPRTIVLDNKYEGAVAINIWTGFACNVLSKSGTRKILTGPTSYLLAYDECLESLNLSVGNPKTSDGRFKTSYLRVLNNKISDALIAETKDLCSVTIGMSYRVNFEGDNSKWFNVENYVGLLVDRMRSLIKSCVKQYNIEDFYSNSIPIIRNVILGERTEDKRKGYHFEENDMRIVEVEISGVTIGDLLISKLLREAQNETVTQTLKIAAANRRLDLEKREEEIEQTITKIRNETALGKALSEQDQLKAKLQVNLAELNIELELKKEKLEKELALQEIINDIKINELDRAEKINFLENQIQKDKDELQIALIEAKAKEFVTRVEAVSPQLISAIQSLGDKNLVGELSKNLSPLAILGGESISDVFQRLVKGTILEKVNLSPKEEI